MFIVPLLNVHECSLALMSDNGAIAPGMNDSEILTDSDSDSDSHIFCR